MVSGKGLGLRAQGLGFQVWSLGFRVTGQGLSVWGSDFRLQDFCGRFEFLGLGFMVQALALRV